jgi:hypothetical protein
MCTVLWEHICKIFRHVDHFVSTGDGGEKDRPASIQTRRWGDRQTEDLGMTRWQQQKRATRERFGPGRGYIYVYRERGLLVDLKTKWP